jgi:cytochrome c-type biogenesis protein CcmE
MKARHRRFAWIGMGLVALAGAAALVLNAFQSNLVFFFTPSQVVAKEAIDQAHRKSAMTLPSMEKTKQ